MGETDGGSDGRVDELGQLVPAMSLLELANLQQGIDALVTTELERRSQLVLERLFQGEFGRAILIRDRVHIVGRGNSIYVMLSCFWNRTQVDRALQSLVHCAFARDGIGVSSITAPGKNPQEILEALAEDDVDPSLLSGPNYVTLLIPAVKFEELGLAVNADVSDGAIGKVVDEVRVPLRRAGTVSR